MVTRTPPFNEGDRIELVRMPDDPHPIEPGSRGTVVSCCDLSTGGKDSWQLTVRWDDAKWSLSLVIPPDVVRRV